MLSASKLDLAAHAERNARCAGVGPDRLAVAGSRQEVADPELVEVQRAGCDRGHVPLARRDLLLDCRGKLTSFSLARSVKGIESFKDGFVEDNLLYRP